MVVPSRRVTSMSQDVHLLPRAAELRAALSRLRASERLSDVVTRTQRETLYDTFDWRVLDASLELGHDDGGTLTLRDADGGIVADLPETGAPDFEWNLPDGALRDALVGPIEMRRLQPFAVVRTTERSVSIVDDEGKTRVRLTLTTFSASPVADGADARVSVTGSVRVRELRGYGKDAERVRALLTDELGPPTTQAPLARRVADALSLAPLSYRPKVALEFERGERTDVAMKRIYLQLLDVVEANEAGTRDDVDSEFLHDLRVAVRRTRSGLSQVRGSMPQQTHERFKREFKWLGTVTGPQRDADVALLTLPDYLKDLPDESHADLEPLREMLVEEQRAAHELLVKAMASARYRRLTSSWRTLLERPAPRHTRLPNAMRPIHDTAAECIWKAYRRVRKRGRRIRPETPDEAVHDLRIDAKKLRYVLAFFGTCFDKQGVSDLLRSLKRLQDNLGTFNDLSVQQETLRKHAEALARSGRGGTATLLALGRLVEVLARRQVAERRRFHDAFESFGSKETRDAVETLLFPGAGGDRR